MFKLQACDYPTLEGSGTEKADIVVVNYTGLELGTALDVLLKAYEESGGMELILMSRAAGTHQQHKMFDYFGLFEYRAGTPFTH